MANALTSTKRVQVDKANATIVAVMAAASFIVVFSLVASRALLSQRSYQARVISKKEQARDQLKSNIDEATKLTTSYQVFIGGSANLIGGNPTGQGDKDGDNAKIVLDALPSSYDFPALASSVEKLLSQPNLKITSITGSDDQLNQQTSDGVSQPAPVAMPFQAAVEGNFGSISSLLATLEKSIRPIKVQTLNFQANQNTITLTITGQTYYQPAVSLKNATEVVK